METQNYENFRQIMRSEHLIPPNENTSELDIFYTFSSLDLKELETYLKELPSRKSDISTQMFASTIPQALIFPRHSYVLDSFGKTEKISIEKIPQVKSNFSLFNKISIKKSKYQIDLKNCRDLANKNEYIRFPNKREPLNSTTNKSFTINPKSSQKRNSSFNQNISIVPSIIYPTREKFQSFHESNRVRPPFQQAIASLKENFDLILHYTNILKMKKIEEIKISQIKPKNYELKVENNLNCKGLYEFKGKIPKKTHNQKIKIPQQFFKILSQKILSDIADYEKIVKHYKAKKPYDITSHKITQVLLQTKIENKNQSNKKLLKQDLFILNLLLKIQKKGISNIIHKDIELLETIIYERKQQIKTLINYIFLPIEPYLSKPIMRAGPIDRKVNQNLPQIKFNGTHHTDLKKIESFFSNELKKTVKVNENNNLKNFDSKSILSLKINSTNQIKQTVKSKNKNSPGPFKKIKSEIPKSSSENKNNKIIERNKTINDLFNFNNRKKKDFSKIRKIHSCETNLSSYSYEGNTLRNNNKLFLSEEDMIQVADKTSIIQAHKQGFPEKQPEQKDERKNFNSWSQFLKKSIEFSQTLPEIIKTYDFSNDSLYNETVSKVENFLKDFFNKENINDVTEKTRVKTILNEKEKRKPRKKRNERLQKHNIDLSPINKNLRKKLKRIKNIKKKNSFHSLFDFGENLNLSLNTGSSKFENNSNILDQNLSQIFADYKEAQKIEETQINQKSKERKKNIKKKLTTSKSTSMIIKPSKPIVSSIPGRNVNKPKKQSPNLKLKHASKKKKKGPKIIIKKKIEKILPSSPKILNETFKENELEIKLNKEEVKSLDEYLLNEVLNEYPDFFHGMEEENQNRMNLEDMINLRHWALKRKRRSFGEILKKKPLFKSASFRVIEENREEIKLLKTFRTNLKNERRAKRKDDVKDLDKIIEENKKTQLTERSNFNETLKLNMKKNEIMKKFFEMDIKDMKEKVDKKIEQFLKRKQNKISETLKTHIEKFNKIKIRVNSTEKINNKIDEHLDSRPSIMSELINFRKEKKKVDENINKSEDIAYKFQNQVKLFMKNDSTSKTESFLHQMLMKLNKNFFDFESFNKAHFFEIFETKKRMKNFLLEKKILALFRNFLNIYNSDIHQSSLVDIFDFKLNDAEIGAIQNNAETVRKDLIEKKSVDFVKKAAIVLKILKEIKEKDPKSFQKVLKKCDKIKNLTNHFNFWVYISEKNKQLE